MKRHSTLLAVCGALALAATGCVGDLDPVGPGDINDPDPIAPDAGNQDPGDPVGTAQALFDTNVHPVVLANCGLNGGACHANVQAPVFAVEDLVDAYNQITNVSSDQLVRGFDPALSNLLIYGTNNHNQAVHTPDQQSQIEAWLAAEQQEADGDIAASPLAIWSGCMNLEEWQAAGVADAWADKNAQGQGNCDACHNLGADKFIASNDDVRVFENTTTNPSLMPSYFTLDATGTTVIINRARLAMVGTGQAPHQEHGGFDIDNDNRDAMLKLENFYNQTMTRMNANPPLCDPPRFQ